jgi:hypothetical protein
MVSILDSPRRKTRAGVSFPLFPVSGAARRVKGTGLPRTRGSRNDEDGGVIAKSMTALVINPPHVSARSTTQIFLLEEA